jgi:hypothetical protein
MIKFMSAIRRFLFMGKKFFLLFLFYIYLTSSAQVVGKKSKPLPTLYGLGGYYNFQNKGLAIDIRAKIPVLKNTFISPRISYYPSFNKIHEIYGGLDADYHFLKYKFLNPYAYLGLYYDNWFNSTDFTSEKAKQSNILFEGGLGVVFDVKKCFYPYLEYRYDPHWKEGSMGAGVLFDFKCMFNGKARKIRNSCPRT